MPFWPIKSWPLSIEAAHVIPGMKHIGQSLHGVTRSTLEIIGTACRPVRLSNKLQVTFTL